MVSRFAFPNMMSHTTGGCTFPKDSHAACRPQLPGNSGKRVAAAIID